MPENIDQAKKAAILAAISMCFGKPAAAMFLRNGADFGWSKQSRRQFNAGRVCK